MWWWWCVRMVKSKSTPWPCSFYQSNVLASESLFPRTRNSWKDWGELGEKVRRQRVCMWKGRVLHWCPGHVLPWGSNWDRASVWLSVQGWEQKLLQDSCCCCCCHFSGISSQTPVTVEEWRCQSLVDQHHDNSSQKALVSCPVCILTSCFKTTRWGEQLSQIVQVVKGNDPLFQPFLQVILFQVACEVILANSRYRQCFKWITK